MITRKNRKRIWLRSAVAGMAALTCLSATGCAAGKPQVEEKQIAVIIKTDGSGYWENVERACEDAQEEMMGINVICYKPSDTSVNAQIASLNEAVAAGADVVVIAPIDADMENEDIANTGVPVITIDGDISDTNSRMAYIGTQNVYAAQIAGRCVQDILGDEGKIGVIYHGDAVTADQRKSGFASVFTPRNEENAMPAGAGSKQNNSQAQSADAVAPEDAVAADEEAAPETQAAPEPETNIRIEEMVDGESDEVISKDQAKALIKEKHVNLIYATNQPGTKGACEAIDELIKDGTIQEGEVQLVGFDYFDGAYEYITTGVLNAVIVQNPYNMGYFGVRYARNLANGNEDIQPMIDTGVTVVTKGNIREDYVQFLVNPQYD